MNLSYYLPEQTDVLFIPKRRKKVNMLQAVKNLKRIVIWATTATKMRKIISPSFVAQDVS
jgi:hypothetical protein